MSSPKLTRHLPKAFCITFFPLPSCLHVSSAPFRTQTSAHPIMDSDREARAASRRFYADLLGSPSISTDSSWSSPTQKAELELTEELEHVLRGTKSFTARSFKSRASTLTLRVPSNRSNIENLSMQAGEMTQQPGLNVPISGSVLGEIAPNSQHMRGGPVKGGRSPTPSMKRKKVESLVKAHGSPQHIRVTAGGTFSPHQITETSAMLA